jgi:hypothetical protein
MEARVGIEPAYTELQALGIRDLKPFIFNSLQNYYKVISALIPSFLKPMISACYVFVFAVILVKPHPEMFTESGEAES